MYTVWYVDKYKITFKLAINRTNEILQRIVVSSGPSRPGITDARARYRVATRRLRNTALHGLIVTTGQSEHKLRKCKHKTSAQRKWKHKSNAQRMRSCLLTVFLMYCPNQTEVNTYLARQYSSNLSEVTQVFFQINPKERRNCHIQLK